MGFTNFAYRMKKHFYLILFLFALSAPISGFGQQLGDNILLNGNCISATPVKKGFNPHVSVTLGTSFGSFYPGFNSFGTYIMPEITAPVTNKFSVGVGMGYSSLFNSYPGEQSLFGSTPQQYGSVYVKGIYQLNEHVTISAMGYKTFNLQPSLQKETINPHALDLNNEGVMINLNYKVSDKFEINAAFSYDKRNVNPYTYPGGMMNGGFHNPALGGFGGYNPGF